MASNKFLKVTLLLFFITNSIVSVVTQMPLTTYQTTQTTGQSEDFLAGVTKGYTAAQTMGPLNCAPQRPAGRRGPPPKPAAQSNPLSALFG